MIEVQKNNPLHGLKLEVLLTELVEHYGWDVMSDEFNFNCFKSNPSIKSSLKFLRKTPWAREKVESFFLYKYKRLPKPSDSEYELPPRDRTIPLHQKPGKPADIKPRDKAERDKAERERAAEKTARAPANDKPKSGKKSSDDVWGHWRK